MSTQRLEQLKQELAQVMAEELAIAAELASASQRQRAVRKEVARKTKQVIAAEVQVAYEASIQPIDTKRFF